jgi:hypothetical protein
MEEPLDEVSFLYDEVLEQQKLAEISGELAIIHITDVPEEPAGGLDRSDNRDTGQLPVELRSGNNSLVELMDSNKEHDLNELRFPRRI